MAVLTPPRQDAGLKPSLPMHRFSVVQYHRMIETGVLTGDDRVELLDGWIVSKMPHNPPHDGTIGIALKLLWTRLPDDWIVRVQSSITLAESEPEPDLVIARGPNERYLRSHPRPKDVALVIEVSASTLVHDRGVKASIYARARIPAYWIINLQDQETKLEVYGQPKAGKSPGYRSCREFRVGDEVPLILDGSDLGAIAVRDLLPEI